MTVFNSELEAFAKDHNLDQSALEELADGVMRRVQYAVSNGHIMTEELIIQATQHWFLSREKLFNDYLGNVNGTRDKLNSEVYDLLKGK